MPTVAELMLSLCKQWVSQKIWKRINLNWRLSSGIEIQLTCRSDWDIYNEIFVDLDYDAPILATLRDASTKPSQVTVLDLGANVGFFGLRWLHLQIETKFTGRSLGYFVEGGRDVYETLRRRLDPMTGTLMDARCIHGLAGEKKGDTLFHRSPAHFGNSVHATNSGVSEKVSYVNLDQLCQDSERIHLIKCDIEGSEETWITSYPELLAKTDRLVIELHKNQVNIENCDRLIRMAGFDHSEILKDRPEFIVVHYWRYS